MRKLTFLTKTVRLIKIFKLLNTEKFHIERIYDKKICYGDPGARNFFQFGFLLAAGGCSLTKLYLVRYLYQVESLVSYAISPFSHYVSFVV